MQSHQSKLLVFEVLAIVPALVASTFAAKQASGTTQIICLVATVIGVCAAAALVLTRAACVRVSRVFSKRVESVHAMLERVVEGDLTARVVIVGDDRLARLTQTLHAALDRIGAAFSNIGDGVVALSRASEDLSLVGSSLNASADDTSRQAGVVATASEQAGKNVQTVAAGTEEMSVTIKEIAKNAAEAAKVATAAVGRNG